MNFDQRNKQGKLIAPQFSYPKKFSSKNKKFVKTTVAL